jgi:hypothetical protein
VDAWVMHANGQYVKAMPPKSRRAIPNEFVSAQNQLMAMYSGSKN